MTTVDDRIVSLRFDNKQFEAAVSTSISSMDKLKSSMNFSAASKGLTDLESTANKFSLGGMLGTVSGVSKAFLALSTVAITALANITNKAIDAGLALAKSLTIGPIGEGFDDYNTKLTSVQTIMSATGKTIQDVNKDFSELDTYADKTIYNLKDMTDSLAKFVNAGVDTKKAVPAIKGIANMVALAGQGAGAAQIAMYNLSQSIAGGFLTTTDYKSLNLANVATKEWKDQIIQSAIAAGTLKKAGGGMYEVLSGDKPSTALNSAALFSEKLSEGWATTEVLLTTLGKYGDETTKIGKKAQAAAQDVKSLPMMFDTLKAAVGTSWTTTFELVLGDLNEAKVLFTTLTNAIGGFLDRMGDARNNLLATWKELGGRTALIDGLKAAFSAVAAVLKPIGEAFREIFPPTTGKQLYDLTLRFKNFMESIKIGAETADKIKRAFKGVFALFSIGWQIAKGLFGVFSGLFGEMSSGRGRLLDFLATIGDMVVNFEQALKNGKGLQTFFEGLQAVLTVPIELFNTLADILSNLFSGKATGGASDVVSDALGRLGDRLASIYDLAKTVGGAFAQLGNVFRKVKNFLQPVIDFFGSIFSDIGNSIAKTMSSDDFDAVFDGLNTVLLGGIVLLLKKFLASGINVDLTGGVMGAISDSFGALTGQLTAMQTQVKAKSLLMIGGAVALLVASLVALSLIDSKALTKALTALGVVFVQLLAGMTVLSKVAGSAAMVKTPVIAASLILLSTAILILSAAVTVLSKLSWSELAKGLLGVAVAMGVMVIGAKALGKAGGPMIRAGLAMIPLAVALKILASAVADFGAMDWGTIGKGLVALAGALIIISLAVNAIPASVLLIGPGLIAVGVALKVIASAVADFGAMDWGTMGKGLLAMAGALLIIAGAVAIMPPTMILQAAGLLVLSTALVILGKALKSMGGMTWEEIAKGLVTLAGALVIIAAGLYAMTGTIAGSAALLVAAAALAILAPVLKVLGSLGWGDLLKALAALAGVFVVLGLAGLILAPIIPAILGLGVSLVLLGAGLALAGAGVLALAVAFTLFVAAGNAGIAIVAGMIALIPSFAAKLAEGIAQFIVTLASNAQRIFEAFVKLLTGLIDAVITITPKIEKLIRTLLNSLINILIEYVPRFIKLGFRLLMGLLRGIEDNIGRIVDTVTRIIVKFINALGKNIPLILDAGARFIISFINGLSKTIDDHAEELGRAAGKLGVSIVNGMINGAKGMIGEAVEAIKNVGRAVIEGAMSIFDSHSPSRVFAYIGATLPAGLAVGVKNNGDVAIKSVNQMGKNTIAAMSTTMSKIGDEFSANADFNPTITPVIDLSNVARGANRMNDILAGSPITATATYRQASDISNTQKASSTIGLDSTSPSARGETKIEFKQYNNSPKALSPLEIYRQTRNQLSLAKEVLNK